MRGRSGKLAGIVVGLAFLLAAAGGIATVHRMGGIVIVQSWLHPAASAETLPLPEDSSVALTPGQPGAIDVKPTLVASLGVRAVEATLPAPRSLELAGSLALDSARLARVRTRFGGEVVEVGQIHEVGTSTTPETTSRPLRLGDRVTKGQVLAVVWSKDLGEKKSELIDALSQLRLDRETLDSLEEGYQKGTIPEQRVREARRAVDGDLIAASRAERTLRAWRLSDAEIDALRSEAEKISQRKGERDAAKERSWARVEVTAPFDGVVVERNVAINDLVDTSLDLFKVADLTRLSVWAHAYEEDLPALNALPRPIPWSVRLRAERDAKPVEGTATQIGYLVDPTQHTVLVMGEVENRDGALRAGQFIAASVQLPPTPDVASIPIGALIEDGGASSVFVQPDAKANRFVLRRVAVVWRGQEAAHVRTRLAPEDEAKGLKPVALGERVVVSGAIELRAALEDLKSSAKRE